MQRILFLWSAPGERSIREKLELHIRSVAREHGLEIQDDRKQIVGDDLANAMDFVNRAVVVVPLISPSLLELHRRELSRALLRRGREEAIVFPVLARDTARPSAHEQGIFGLVFAPDGRPVARWPDLDQACAVVAEQLRRTLENRLPRIQAVAQPSPQYESESIQQLGEALNRVLVQLELLQEREERLLSEYRELQRKMRLEGRLLAGDILSHRFRLLCRTHLGEHVTSWDGWDLRSERTVMVHELSQLVAMSSSLREQALWRVEQAAAVEHPAAVAVICARGHDAVHDFFVTEPLDRRLSAVGFSRRFSMNAVLSLGLCLGGALAELHRKGLVHGAVRPDNVHCAEDGRHKLGCLDVLAGADAPGAGASGLPVWGTASAYTAPELTSLGTKHVDQRADVYGLAMTLAALIYGADLGLRPREHLAAVIDGLDCGVRVRHALRQALSSDPFGRPDTVEAFCADLVAAHRAHRSHSGEASPGRRAGTLEMVAIPEAEIDLGGGEDARPHELPVHRVRVSSFEIGKYPVTVSQYAEVMALPGAPGPGRADWPVTHVSVRDAVQFCNRLSAIEGLRPAYDLQNGEIRWLCDSDGYRLPLEAEWELAARGTDNRQFAWGNEAPAWQLCWDGERPAVGDRPRRLAGNQTNPESVLAHPAGASFHGVQDMQGNVWEWCWDWFSRYEEADGLLVNPAGPDTPEHPEEGPGPGAYRVLRGGSWRSNKPSRVRAAARSFDDEIVRHVDIGFRVARGPKPCVNGVELAPPTGGA